MDDYVWEVTRSRVRRSPGSVPRWKAIGRVLMRFVPVVIGVILISTAYQYVVWRNGPAYVLESIRHMMTFHNPEGEDRMEEYLRDRLGLDKPFIPDCWPFDNESLWYSEQNDYHTR